MLANHSALLTGDPWGSAADCRQAIHYLIVFWYQV